MSATVMDNGFSKATLLFENQFAKKFGKVKTPIHKNYESLQTFGKVVNKEDGIQDLIEFSNKTEVFANLTIPKKELSPNKLKGYKSLIDNKHKEFKAIYLFLDAMDDLDSKRKKVHKHLKLIYEALSYVSDMIQINIEILEAKGKMAKSNSKSVSLDTFIKNIKKAA